MLPWPRGRHRRRRHDNSRGRGRLDGLGGAHVGDAQLVAGVGGQGVAAHQLIGHPVRELRGQPPGAVDSGQFLVLGAKARALLLQVPDKQAILKQVQADVAIRDGRIAEVGQVSGATRATLHAHGAWLTPGFVMGLVAAILLLLPLVRLPPRGRGLAALLALAAAVILVNCTPENPYRSVPIHLLPGRIGHFLSFSSMIRALSDLWPFLTLLFLLVSLPLRYAPNRR